MQNYVSVGGLGGSGTRVVADLLRSSGTYIGNDLIESLDNLHFTRLFKNPAFYNSSTDEHLKRMHLLLKICRREKLNQEERAFYKEAARDNIAFCPYEESRIEKALRPPLLLRKPGLCGWKEPNTHLYAGELLSNFEGMRYIHVLRNGLDMAFSTNRQQLEIWGHLYGFHEKDEKARLAFWIATTRKILELREKFTDRLLIVRYDQLLEQPDERASEILEFLGLTVSKRKLDRWKNDIRIPPLKYSGKDLSLFGKDQLQFVQDMGFRLKS